jgi:hypothetical protein
MTAPPSPSTAKTATPAKTSVPKSWTASLWAFLVLNLAGLPDTTNNITNMLRWMRRESGTTWDVRNNPLNTGVGTTAVTGSSGFPNLIVAAQNTANALKMPNYTAVYHALAQTATAHTFSAAVVASPWASSHYGGTPTNIATTPPVTPTQKGQSTTATPATLVGTTSTVGLFTWVHNAYHWLNTHGLGSPFPGSVGKAVTNTLGGLADVTKFFSHLTNVNNWRRAGIFAGGAALVVLGLFFLAQGSKSVRGAEGDMAKAAGTAAVA